MKRLKPWLLALIHPLMIGLYIGITIGTIGMGWNTELSIVFPLLGILLYIGIVRKIKRRGKLTPDNLSVWNI